jgi:hypothetical protein
MRVALWNRRYAYSAHVQGTARGDRAEGSGAILSRAQESTFHENERAHAVAEGRREVWLRIQHHLKLTPDQLWELYAGLPASED